MKFDEELEIVPAIFGSADDGARIMAVEEILPEKLLEISCGGLGCCLISRKVVESVPFGYFENTKTGDDIKFYVDAQKKGFSCYADTSVKCNFQMPKEGFNRFFSFDEHPQIRKPNVLIGCVTHDKDETYLKGFLEAVRSQTYSNFDVLFVDTSDDEGYTPKLKSTGYKVIRDKGKHDHIIKKITSGRNIIREHAIKNKYDYVLYIDTDVVPPPNALAKMLSDRKDVVAGLCLISSNLKGNVRIIPNTYDFDDEEGFCRPMVVQDVLNGQIREVSCAGFGCTMVTRKALEAVEFRFYEKSMAGEDIAFFVDARIKGFKTFADNSVKCVHVVFPPGDPRNRKFMFDTYEKGVNYNTSINVGS
jgi:hypothetical protein